MHNWIPSVVERTHNKRIKLIKIEICLLTDWFCSMVKCYGLYDLSFFIIEFNLFLKYFAHNLILRSVAITQVTRWLNYETESCHANHIHRTPTRLTGRNDINLSGQLTVFPSLLELYVLHLFNKWLFYTYLYWSNLKSYLQFQCIFTSIIKRNS